MGDRNYQHPVALHWDQGPQKLRPLKTKLQLYFGSKSKSDGGECEIRDTDCSRGYILIHYKEEEARDRVLQRKTHELKLPDGETLQLEVRLPEDIQSTETSPPPQDEAGICGTEKSQKLSEQPTLEKELVSPKHSSSPVLITNIPDSYTQEMVNLLVENVCEKVMNTDFCIENIPEIRSAVITFTCDIDVADFIGKFSDNQKVKQHKITAGSMEETRSVRVEGIPPNTPEDIVTCYFESIRNGRGSVEDVEMLSDERAALVTFHQAGVLKTVMTKRHVLNNNTISVYPYYPSIGHCLYGKDGPHIQIPDSVEIPISPHILAFILKDEQIKRNVEKAMADVSCDITWPNVDHPAPAIKLSLSRNLCSHLRTLAKIAPTWSDNIHKTFKLFISHYKAAECDLKPPVWEAIKEKMSSSSYDGVLIKPDLAAEKVFIVGISESVEKIEPIFIKLVEETARQLSRVEDEVPLEPEAYKLMMAHGLEKSILEDSPHVKISYDGTSKAVKLYGPENEVLTAKCEILNSKQGLKSETVHLDPHIIQFLKTADNGELSCSLLMKNNIKAAFQVEHNAVLLTGYSDKDLRDGEETVKKELVSKRVPVEDKSVAQSPEWRNLKSFLKEKFNVDGMKVSIEEFPVRDGAEVVITGLSSPAEETYQQIHDFVEKNTLVEKDIKLKSVAVLQFMEEKRKKKWNEIIQNVKVVKKQNLISLSGPKFYVEEAENCIRKMTSKMYPDTLYIDKPGVKKFFIENEDMYVTTIWNKHQCVIHLQNEVDDRISIESRCQVSLQNGATMVIYKGDLCQHNADVIIIASNENLKPTEGPALALVKAAGPGLQKECERIVQKEGGLYPGECVMTDVSDLPCKKIIHAFGPKLDQKENVKCERILQKVITESLEMAAGNGQSSVALSVGDFVTSGCPLDLCAQNIVKSIKSFTENQEGANAIKNIHLVDNDEGVLKTITELLNEEFEAVQLTLKNGLKKQKTTPKKVEMMNKVNDQMVTTRGGLNISLKQGNIEDATTDVVVNCMGTEPNLRQVEDGSIIVTDICNLSCDSVIHAVVPEWDGENGSSVKILRNIVSYCLSSTEEKQYESITIPVIGTGILGYPRNIVAALMCEEILEFSSRNQLQYLKQIDFMLHPSDTETIQAFSSELEKKISAGEQNKVQKLTSFFFTISLSTLAFLWIICQFMIGFFWNINQSDKNHYGKEEEKKDKESKVFELRENIEPAIFNLCAESRESVKKAIDRLQKLVAKDQNDSTIENEWIRDLDDEDHDILAQLQRDNGVHITFNSPQSTIKVTGRIKDVLEVRVKIENMVKSVQEKKMREREARLYSNKVEWGYYQGTNFIPFGQMTNFKLERAYHDQLSSVDIDITGVKYLVIIELRSATDAKGNKIKLQRNIKNDESLIIPPHWDAMDKAQLKVVPVNVSSPEYSEVAGLFAQTCQMRIIKIERIQNKDLYQNYQIKKNSIDTKNGTKTNEKRLFHGTESGITENINHNGFNRAYAGSNAALLGRGTYFAAEAIYSADDTYSKPDTKGHKYMYLARVATGVYCVGNSAMIAPPAKSASNPTDLYDSVTDNISGPSVFVIFNDVQAYPEYLITFTKFIK